MSDSPAKQSLDCTIYVRRYLIKRRSALGGIGLYSGGYKFVYVPVDTVETKNGIVALRSRPGGLERDVGFVLMKDLHKHSSVIYQNQSKSTEPFRFQAHGVALVESNQGGFEYRRGDKFWLFDKQTSKAEDGGNLAPVINLRTGEYGSVIITDVCWYPDVEEDDGDILTVMGCFREIRGGRAGTSIRTIYRVSHRLQAFGQVKINKDLMPKEKRKRLFLQTWKERDNVIESEDLSFLAQGITPSAPLSPPLTPPSTAPPPLAPPLRKAQSLSREKSEPSPSAASVEPASVSSGNERQSIYSTTIAAPKEEPAPPPESSNPQNRPPPLRARRNQLKIKIATPHSSPPTDVDSSTTSFSSSDSNSSSTSTTASSIHGSDRLSSAELDLEEDYGEICVLESPEPLTNIRRQLRQSFRPYSSFVKEAPHSPEIVQIPTKWGSNALIAERAFSKRKEGQIDVELGDIITDVEYSPVVDIRKEHFWRGRNPRGLVGEFPSWVSGHDTRDSPPFKKSRYDLAECYPGRCREKRPHRCCVSFLRPAPGLIGCCDLGARPRTGRPHICCVWSKEDWERANIPADAEPRFDDRKLRETQALPSGHGRIWDRSSFAEERRVRHPPEEAAYVMKKLTGAEW